MKETLDLVLRMSPLWSIPINVVIAIIAAHEGANGEKPIKTAVAVAAFILLLTVLVFCRYML